MTLSIRIVCAIACLLPPYAIADVPDHETSLETRISAMGNIGRASDPQYSPDGSEIAFITTLSGTPQAWRIPASGGYPQPVTAYADSVSGLRWAPDGKRVAYAVSPGGGYNAQLFVATPDGVDVVRMNEGEHNTFSGDFAKDGRYYFSSNARSGASMDTWIWDPITGIATLAIEMQGLGGISDLSGKQALVSRLVTRGNSNLWLDDLSSGKSILLTPHKGAAESVGKFGATTSIVLLGHNLGRDRMEFARIDIGTNGKPSAPRTLAAREDAELDSFELSDDRSTALLVWNVAGRNELELIEIESGKRRPMPAAPSELVYGADFAPDGRKIALTLAGSTAPPDLWQFDLASGKFTRLTLSPHNGVDMATLVRPELRTYKSHDGLELSGWLYLPSGFKTPGPVVLSFHGGPEGQEQPAFRADYQALLASGIAVFAPNIRGSSGFGKAFMALDNQALRFDANRDIKSTADFLVDAGIGAKGRLGITGGSYGGYVVLVAVTEFPDTFAAGADLFGMVNFETFFSQSTPWMSAISTGEYGDPKTQLKLLRDLSPIRKLDRVITPLLVMHGANDTNVPVVEAEQVVDNLKKRGVEVQYILFPDEGHGWRKQPNRVRSTLELTRFFRTHLVAQAAAGSK